LIHTHALYTDESGGPEDAWRTLSGVAGPLALLEALQRQLADAARMHGVEDLKWNQVRTRVSRLEACCQYFDLASQAIPKGLWMACILWKPKEGLRTAMQKNDDRKALKEAYARLLQMADREHPGAAFIFHPDQRTGMDWESLMSRAKLKNPSGPWVAWRQVRSNHSPLTQLADLCAGLARSSRKAARTESLPTHQNRRRIIQAYKPFIHLKVVHDLK
jgi:hypothetical protein